MKFRFCMAVPDGYVAAEFRFYLDDDGQFCEAPATRQPIETCFIKSSAADHHLGNWRPESKLHHCVPMPSYKERFPC